MLGQLAFKGFEDDVEHPIRIQIEVPDDGADHFQDFGRRRVRHVLVEFGDELGVTFAFFSQQVELLLLVAEEVEEEKKSVIGRLIGPDGSPGRRRPPLLDGSLGYSQ